jgi:hypothetical protein
MVLADLQSGDYGQDRALSMNRHILMYSETP